MPEIEDEDYVTDFEVDFSAYSDLEKFELIEHIIHGDTVDIEGEAHVILEFNLGDYAPKW